MPSLSSMGFTATHQPFPSIIPDEDIIKHYDKERDYPAKLTSRMGIHLRFGTISTRELSGVNFIK
jgi:deoxyribodipyrimidine photo-lyase